MNTVIVENCKTLFIGRRGENEVTEVLFDFSEWQEQFGAGVIDLYVKRNLDIDAYPVVLSVDGTVATWLVTAADTDVVGNGKIEFVYTVDQKVAKSAVFPFFVGDDIGESSPEPPEHYQSWLEQLTELGAETQINAQAAAESASEAAQSASEAAESAAQVAEDSDNAEAWAVGERNGEPVSEGDPTYNNNAKYWAENARANAPVQSVNGEDGVVVLTLDDIPNGVQYARTTPAQVQQIGDNAADIADIEELIPTEAGANNQLADKNYVDSRDQTNTDAISAINAKIPANASESNKLTDESRVNTIVNAKLTYYRTAASQKSIDDAQDIVIASKQPKITASGILKGDGAGGVSAAVAGTDYATPQQVDAKYTKPADGIPSTDMTAAVQASLQKADTALQSAPVTSVNGQTGDVTIQPATDAQVTTAVNTWLGENVAQETGYVLDASLTMSNAAPPASAVGELKSANDYVIKTKFPDTFEAVPFLSNGGFVKGRINTTTGVNASSTTRARRYNSFLSGNYVSLGTDDYEYTLFYYDGVGSSWADTYTHVYSDWIKGSVWTLIDDSIGDRARIVVRHPDDSTISDGDLDILTRVCVARNLNQITPQITTKKGNPVYIGELEALARDWYSHRNDIVSGSKAMVYGNNSILSTSSYTREIDCSTFVGMLLRGYGFSQTPYATGQGASPDSWTGNTAYNWTFNPFDYSNYSRIDSKSRTKVRYASQMAEMMIERGQTVPIDRYYANIEPGDVLFFARHDSTTNDWYEPLRFKHINHVAICIAKEKATSADGWDTATYPWKHTFAEVGHEDETTPDGVIKIRTLEQPQGDTSAIFENNINTLCLVCRPDLGSI